MHALGEPRTCTVIRCVSLTESIMSKNSGSTNEPGGVSRIRTGDPLLAKQVLYQLSYNPS